jgi:signal transduction histidine kinase
MTVTVSTVKAFAKKCRPGRMLPEVDQRPSAGGGSFEFGPSDLVMFWQRLRFGFLLLLMAVTLGLAVDWGASLLRPALVVALSTGLLADAMVRIRRRGTNPIPPLLLDAGATGIGLAFLQVDVHAWIGPFLYVALSAAVLLPWRRALAMWGYDVLVGALVVLTAGPLTSWLGPSPAGTRVAALVWVVTALFAALSLAEVLLLIGAIHRFTEARHSRLAFQAQRKDEFLAGVSHALRTPLTCVVGFGQLIERDWADHLPAPVGVMLGELNQQADVMAAMVDNLVTRAQDLAGELTVSAEPVDLHQIASDVIRSLAWLYPDKEIRLTAGRDLVAWADPTRSRQIVRNLVSNAIQHGGSHITVEAGNDGAVIFFSVTDDGPGPVTCGGGLHLHPFEKTTAAFGSPSLGLGLPISQRLAQVMGGSLTHVHTPGISTFRLTVPRFVLLPQDEAAPDPAPPCRVPAVPAEVSLDDPLEMCGVSRAR